MAAAFRVIVAFLIAAAMTAGWLLFAVLVMGVSLYFAKLVPLTGWRRRSERISRR